MATKRKSVKMAEIMPETGEVKIVEDKKTEQVSINNISKPEKINNDTTENIVVPEKNYDVAKKNKPKFAIGSIVFVSKDAEADLNGFKLFPPYKKSTYTVEAYDDHTGVYSLRRLNLSLRLKESDIVAPGERAHDPLNRKQF